MPSLPLPPRVFVALLMLGAFLFRLGTVVAFRDLSEGPTGGISNDDVQFNRLAVNLAEGHGYRITPDRPLTSFRAPGFPFVLAGLYAITGESPPAAYLLFCVLGALACVLTYLLAREVLTDGGAGPAGMLAAVYLPHAYLAATFFSENVYVPCLALGLLLFVCFTKTRRLGLASAAGLVLGWAALTRPGALLLMPLLVAVLAGSDLQVKRFRPFGYVALTVSVLAVILPWTARNHEVHGKWVLIATNGGTTFWGGNNDLVLNEHMQHLGYWVPSTMLPNRDLIDAAAEESEVARDAMEWRFGKEWVRSHLASMPLLELYKFVRLWWLPDYGEGNRWLRIVSYVPFCLLWLAAALRTLRRPACWTVPWQVLHASTLAVVGLALIFCGEPRYRDANMPVLMIYAAVGVYRSRGVRLNSYGIAQAMRTPRFRFSRISAFSN